MSMNVDNDDTYYETLESCQKKCRGAMILKKSFCFSVGSTVAVQLEDGGIVDAWSHSEAWQ